MKFLIFVALATFSLTSLAAEPICKSITGRTLSLEVVYDFGPSYGNVKEHNSIKKQLKDKYDELCKSAKKSSEIIDDMYQECHKASKVVKKLENRERYSRTCDQVNIAARSFMEGIELAEKTEKCEDPSSISSLDRSVKEISDSVKKKETKKSKASAQ